MVCKNALVTNYMLKRRSIAELSGRSVEKSLKVFVKGSVNDETLYSVIPEDRKIIYFFFRLPQINLTCFSHFTIN